MVSGSGWSRRWRFPSACAAFLLGTVALSSSTGCGGGGSSEKVGEFGPLRFSLATDKAAYRQGEPVRLTFTALNQGSLIMELATGTFFALRVSQSGRTVFSPPPPMGPGMNPPSVRLHPGVPRSEVRVWDQKDDAGNSVPPGRYQIRAWLTGNATNITLPPYAEQEARLAAAPVEIVVE